jgi:transcriptional regulator with XRE-family HTH domain
MTFRELHDRLVTEMRQRIRNGGLTERGVARITGISQPHIHNVLKGKRLLSAETADEVLRQLQIDLLDLIKPEDLMGWRRRE